MTPESSTRSGLIRGLRPLVVALCMTGAGCAGGPESSDEGALPSAGHGGGQAGADGSGGGPTAIGGGAGNVSGSGGNGAGLLCPATLHRIREMRPARLRIRAILPNPFPLAIPSIS